MLDGGASVVMDVSLVRRAYGDQRLGPYTRKPAPVLSFVLEEAVLQRPIGGAEVLGGQLEHLLLTGQNPNAGIQVMPTEATDHACVDGPFTLMVPEGGEQVAYLESQGSGRVITDREIVRGIAAR